jgi:hypothetical protein
MAVGDVLRKQVPMDQDDANYMNQFLHDVASWAPRLKERYNEKLEAALDSNQNIKKGTDKSTAKLIRKLKNPAGLDFDIRNIESGTGNLAGFKLMQINNARDILQGSHKTSGKTAHGKIGWIEYSVKQTGSETPQNRFGGRKPKEADSNFVRKQIVAPPGFHFVAMPQPGDEMYGQVFMWTPNWQLRQSFGDPEYDPKRKFISDTMRKQVEQDVLIGVDKALYSLSNPDHAEHYSYKHMLSRKDELINLIVDYIFKTTKTNDWQDPKWRKDIAIRITKTEARKDWGGGTYANAAKTRRLGLDPTQIMLRSRRGRPSIAPTLRKGPTADGHSWQLQKEYPPEPDPVPSPEGYPYTEPPQDKMDRFKSQLSKIKPKKETSAERLEKWRKAFFPAKTG